MVCVADAIQLWDTEPAASVKRSNLEARIMGIGDYKSSKPEQQRDCGKCGGSGFIMMQHLHGAPAPHAPTPSGHTACPVCLGSGKAR